MKSQLKREQLSVPKGREEIKEIKPWTNPPCLLFFLSCLFRFHNTEQNKRSREKREKNDYPTFLLL